MTDLQLASLKENIYLICNDNRNLNLHVKYNLVDRLF